MSNDTHIEDSLPKDSTTDDAVGIPLDCTEVSASLHAARFTAEALAAANITDRHRDELV